MEHELRLQRQELLQLADVRDVAEQQRERGSLSRGPVLAADDALRSLDAEVDAFTVSEDTRRALLLRRTSPG